MLFWKVGGGVGGALPQKPSLLARVHSGAAVASLGGSYKALFWDQPPTLLPTQPPTDVQMLVSFSFFSLLKHHWQVACKRNLFGLVIAERESVMAGGWCRDLIDISTTHSKRTHTRARGKGGCKL